MNKRQKGKEGELIAADYLRKKGFKIIETNFTCRIGEIDIIAKKGDTVCFIEVKLRKSKSFGSPFEAIDWRKREKIFKTAQYYCLVNKIIDKQLRFDAIGINLSEGVPEIEHLENIFS